MKKRQKNPDELFEEYYCALWGERWPSLKEALLREKEEYVSIDGLSSPYYLDEASLVTASILPVKKGDTVLDMCAAPGGKSLVLALSAGNTGRLVANDRSPERRERLRKVLSLIPEERRPEISVTPYNAESWGIYEKEVYDCILLDAPCSSERHVLTSPRQLAQWSPSRPRRLAVSQYAMLSSALMAVKEGGYILYSTCSINSGENEAVVEKLFMRHRGEVEEIVGATGYGEKRSYGRIVLPDTSGGRGPMYCCLIRKTR